MAVRVEQQAIPIPGYRLIERIGGGGFGEVWKAEAPGGLFKAIKFVYGDLSGAGEGGHRAEQELKALRRVQSVRHPYILSLERIDIIDGQLIIVMELADRNLWDRFKECRAQGIPGIPRDELLRYVEESAEALDLMNQEYDLQHLDVKPQNVFLVHNHVKVADFGLVKDLEGSQAAVTGGITPVYAAPETFDGIVTRFSDQYSLGIMYQELLTGQRPFVGNNVRQLILQHLQGAPNVAPLPPGDQPIVARSLSKTPGDRYPTCRDFVQALRGVSPTHRVSPSQVTRESSQGAAAALPVSPLETPSSQGVTQSIRSLDHQPSVLRTEEVNEAVKPKLPKEVKGSGSLFPTVVLGLGQLGMAVLQKLRETLHDHVAGPLSNVRLLLLDTDPEVLRAASRAGPGALGANETLIVPLNRPSHYLKPRDGRPPLESWLNPRMLYRIPRSMVTTGVRALGRLAFIDNYRAIVRRLQHELESSLDEGGLRSAGKTTGLWVRTNRPRVYVVTGLGGGTGGGMFLDVAYNVRALLTQMGYENPDVVGLLLLPPVDSARTRVMSLGNAYAALSELNHYSAPDTAFVAKYHDREAPVRDPAPPFSRTVVLPLPDENDEVASREAVELCGQLLYREMATPMGKAADLGRAGLPSPPWDQRGQFANTFGLFLLASPRRALLRTVSRELSRRIVRRWLSKDSKPVREAVGSWIGQQWTFLELGADSFIHRLQTDAIRALGRPVDSLFSEALAPLTAPAAEAGRSRKAEGRRLGIDQMAEALRGLEELVGRPEDDNTATVEPPRLARLVRDLAEKVAAEWGQKLAELPVQLIEDPRFRLAGAEEAIRLVVSNVEQVLQHHEPLARDLADKAQDAHDHLRVAAGGKPRDGSKLSPKSAEQLAELCRLYPKWRFQQLILSSLTSAFVGLRGHLSDELREVNFCRVRLTELQRSLDEVPSGESPEGKESGIARVLFSSGCKDLAEATAQALSAYDDAKMLELDGEMELMLRSTFTALVHVCLSPQGVVKPVEKAMLQTASDFAARMLPAGSVAKLFLDRHPAEEAEAEAEDLYKQAGPELTLGPSKAPGNAVELCVVAAPADAESEELCKALARSAPRVEIHPAGSAEDVVVYRERLNVALRDLEQFGPQGHDAYTQMNSSDNFTPHSRSDVDFRR